MNEEYLVKKWLNDDLSEEERIAFKASDNADFYEEIIQEAQRFKGKSHAQVASFETLDSKLPNKKTASTNWIRIVSGIAAILILGIAVFTVFENDKVSRYKTVIAQNESIVLPDNSTVELNELSQLEYNATNWDEARVLDLKGEAFFDVEKGNRFDVHTEFGKVSVLGTEFNVLSRDGVFKVSCYEGLVQVTYKNEKMKLPAGFEFTLKSGNAQKTNLVVAQPQWLKNMSVFENALLKDVLAEFEKQYNINVTDASNNTLKFTGAFEHDNIENALKSITQPLNLTYTIENNQKVIISNVQN